MLQATREAAVNPQEFKGFDFNEDDAVLSQSLFIFRIGDQLRPFDGTSEDFQKRVRDSIKITESPYKKTVENNATQTEIAKDSSKIIRDLPPRA